jgi:starch-binding outer membrane protein, SusD/RagB family
MTNKFFTSIITMLAVVILSACHKKLDRTPPNTESTDEVFSSEQGYFSFLARNYASMALTGADGPGSGSIAFLDAGTTDFLRLFWKAQELSTDEAVVAWGDPGIQDFHNMNWSSTNPMLTGLFARSTYIIGLNNVYLRESAPEKLTSRGITGSAAANVTKWRSEARFIRAFQYWVLMDLFGNPPFATEADPQVDKNFRPRQIARAQLFTYIENELKAIEADLPNPRQNGYGRADKAAVWALLARMYLNAEVYTGTGKYAEAVTYSKRVIDAGYSLLSDYTWLMLADNHIANPEAIFTLNYDGITTQNFGGTTILVQASVGGKMDPLLSGTNGGWGGFRTTRNLPLLFPDLNGNGDKRAQFYSGPGSKIEIDTIAEFSNGLPVTKYRNRTRAGGFGNDPNKTFSDIDFPLFRLAEMYLIYAEAVLRGGSTSGGNKSQALIYLNALRTRAQVTGPTLSDYDLNYIIDERGRELYWEAFRRTDLIRFNRFTESVYLWPFKAGQRLGAGTDAFRRLYPIPTLQLVTNPSLIQNPGY